MPLRDADDADGDAFNSLSEAQRIQRFERRAVETRKAHRHAPSCPSPFRAFVFRRGAVETLRDKRPPDVVVTAEELLEMASAPSSAVHLNGQKPRLTQFQVSIHTIHTFLLPFSPHKHTGRFAFWRNCARLLSEQHNHKADGDLKGAVQSDRG